LQGGGAPKVKVANKISEKNLTWAPLIEKMRLRGRRPKESWQRERLGEKKKKRTDSLKGGGGALMRT